MALRKCAECGKDVSDRASVCPNCGNPLSGNRGTTVRVEAFPGQSLKVEPELTSKKWKQIKLVAWGVLVLGTIIGAALQSVGWIFFFWVVGITTLIVAHIGAWYADKRTR